MSAPLGSSTSPTFFSLMSATEEISKSKRRLPHWKKEGATYWITFRLADSIPQEKIRVWKEERDIWIHHNPEPWDTRQWKEYDERFGQRLENWLDNGMGSCALAKPDLRETVKACLCRFDGDRLHLHAAVIMPTHVHLLLEPVVGHDLSRLLKGIKGASAREANKLTGTNGTFWLDESYDHVVRSEEQYQHFVRYIAENPLKARLRQDQFWHYQSGADIPVCENAAS